MPTRARTTAVKPAPEPRRLSTLWKLRGLLVVAVLAAYANSFGLGFALDGSLAVNQDPRIRAVTAENIRLIFDKPFFWPSQTETLYRPAATLSYLLNYAVLGNGAQAGGYHAVNFLLHLANVLLWFALARRLFQRDLPAFFAAALWAVHPIGTEAVTNVAGRPELLAATAVLGGLLVYASTVGTTGGRYWAGIAGLFALALAGVFSNESAAALAAAMLAWDLCFGERSGASLLRRLPFYVAALAAFGVWWTMRSVALGAAPLAPPNFVDNPLLALNFWDSRWMALKIAALDVWLLICPLVLAADRSYNQIPWSGWADPWCWLAVAALAGIIALLIVKRGKDRTAMWAAAFAAIALLPNANLLYRIDTAIAERFLYLPAAGFCAVAAAVVWGWKPERTAATALAILLAVLALRTFARNREWMDNSALAAADVAASPQSARLHDLYGQSLYLKDAEHNLDRAIEQLEAAWAILRPLPPAQQFAPTPAVLGTYYGIKGDLAGADTSQGRAWYEKARAVLVASRDDTEAFQASFDDLQRSHGRPLPPLVEYAPAFFYLGQVYQREGDFQQALRYYQRGVTVEPGNPTGYDALAKALYDHGDYDAAAAAVMTKVLLLGIGDPNVTNGMHEIYAKVAEGDCAFPEEKGGVVNLDCPRVHSDLCKASAALAAAFQEGRQPDKARESQLRAASQYSCPMP